MIPTTVPGGGGNFPGGSDDQESTCNVGNLGLIPRSGRSPWRRKWQPTPVFLPGESHGQRSLAGYSPWGHKELGTTERLSLPPSQRGAVAHLGSMSLNCLKRAKAIAER